MVERSKRGKGKHKLLGNHQKSWIWGRNLVLETLRGGIWTPLELLVAENFNGDDAPEAMKLAGDLGVQYEEVPADRIKQLCGTSEHQGFAAKMSAFPYADEARLPALIPESKPTLIVICDRIQDPHNFGAIVRSADGFGVSAIIIRNTKQVGVTSQVARSSAGAVNHVPIVRTESIVDAAKKLQAAGVTLVACSEKAPQLIGDCDLNRPTALVIGNEGRGVSGEMLAQSDELVSIPMSGTVSSLNAAVAAAVTMYEVARQRA
ncbi:MAG: 23S rRNA (guanosine(2251)-2'-O)-methyltransferase RlmB [Planctomycetaceae bacterium]